MTFKKKGLGRGLSELGLSELLSGQVAAVVAEEAPTSNEKPSGFFELNIDQLKPGQYQPRQQFPQEKLEELADSIRRQGIIQPIVVRSVLNGYEILAGERRWRAARLAGLETVPVVVREMSNENAIAVSLIENIQRQDLNAIEQAQALQRLIDNFGLTHEQAADAVGKNRASITNLLRLLKLSDTIQEYVQNGRLEMGHARALLMLGELDQLKCAKKIIENNLSVRETEKLVKNFSAPAIEEKIVVTHNQDPNIRRVEREISEKLAAKVSIAHQASGQGKLTIHYNSADELDGILAHIQ